MTHNCSQHEATKRGANGVPYIVCTECGETLRRADSHPPRSQQKPLDVSDEKALWDRVAENRAIAAREPYDDKI